MITSLTALVLAQFVIRPAANDPTIDLGTVMNTYANTTPVELAGGEYWIRNNSINNSRRTVRFGSLFRTTAGQVVINVDENVDLQLRMDEPFSNVTFVTMPNDGQQLFVDIVGDTSVNFADSCIARVDFLPGNLTRPVYFEDCSVNVITGDTFRFDSDVQGDWNNDTIVDFRDLQIVLSIYDVGQGMTPFLRVTEVLGYWGWSACN